MEKIKGYENEITKKGPVEFIKRDNMSTVTEQKEYKPGEMSARK